MTEVIRPNYAIEVLERDLARLHEYLKEKRDALEYNRQFAADTERNILTTLDRIKDFETVLKMIK